MNFWKQNVWNSIRGGVFCNAQTANFVLSAVALGNGRWSEFFYYFIPMTAYFMGAFISESVPNYVKWHLHIRWDTMFLLFEMVTINEQIHKMLKEALAKRMPA